MQGFIGVFLDRCCKQFYHQCMDENQFQSPQPPSRSKFKKFLFFTEIGLFEIGFVVILLGAIVGALQFFHVINLSKYQSYLPNISSLVPHFYSQNIAKKDLSTLLFPNSPSFMIQANSQYLPSKDLKNVTVSQKNNIFTATWPPYGKSTSAPYITAYAVYQTKNENFSYASIVFDTGKIASDNTPLSSDSAKTIATSYLPYPSVLAAYPPTWSCNQTTNSCNAGVLYKNDTSGKVTNAYTIFVTKSGATSHILVIGCLTPYVSNARENPSDCLPN